MISEIDLLVFYDEEKVLRTNRNQDPIWTFSLESWSNDKFI